MVKRTTTPISSKKHLARLEKERRQTRLLIIGTSIVIGIVVLSAGYGFVNQYLIRNYKPAAIVNNEEISTRDLYDMVVYQRFMQVSNAYDIFQYIQFLGPDPSTINLIKQQYEQIQTNLEPLSMGTRVLDQMVNDKLIRQKADELGIIVTDEELEKAKQEAFGYFSNGTPTSIPTLEAVATSTLSSLQETLISQPLSVISPTIEPTVLIISPTLESTPTLSTGVMTSTPTPAQALPTKFLTPTATITPFPTPTPFTLEGYQALYSKRIQELKDNYTVKETAIIKVIEDRLYRDKLFDHITSDLTPFDEQVWARHILVKDEDSAKVVLTRLEQGDDFIDLVEEFSTDTGTKPTGGDLGWFSRGSMVPEFEELAFSLGVGEISQPVATQYGWHIIQVLGHEERSLNQYEFQQKKETFFSQWLDEVRSESEIEYFTDWVAGVPKEPDIPLDVKRVLQNPELLFQSPPTPGQ